MLRHPGTLIAELRTAAHLDSHELAEAAGIEAAALEAYERQGKGLSLSAVTRIARFFGVEPVALLRAEAGVEDSLRVHFNQSGPHDFYLDDQQVLAGSMQRARSLLEVNQILSDVEDLRGRLIPEPVGGTPHEDGYRLARKVRALLKNETGLLANLGSLLEVSFSICVSDAELRQERIQAVSMKQRDGVASIVLNSSNKGFGSLMWRRVNLAHELCHILFDEPRSGFDLVADYGEPGRCFSDGSTPNEQRAKAFAAELLIPLAGLEQILGSPYQANKETTALLRIRDVRESFHTTYEVALYQLINQGYLSHSLRDRLLRRWPEEEDPPAQERIESALPGRVRSAWERRLITDLRARELLDLSVWVPLPWEQPDEAGQYGAGADAISA